MDVFRTDRCMKCWRKLSVFMPQYKSGETKAAPADDLQASLERGILPRLATSCPLLAFARDCGYSVPFGKVARPYLASL